MNYLQIDITQLKNNCRKNGEGEGEDKAKSAMLPAYTRAGDAGLDLHAATDAQIAPLSRAMVPCGFAIAIPPGFCGLVIPRSGLAAKHGITILNAPGLIDGNFRGEVQVILYNSDANSTFNVSRGDRIAQLVIIEAPQVKLHEVDFLDETDRGASGFGSSGI